MRIDIGAPGRASPGGSRPRILAPFEPLARVRFMHGYARMTSAAIAPSIFRRPTTIDLDLDPDLVVANEPAPAPEAAPAPARPATLARGERVGAWRVDGELGRGGMGTVYAVTHTDFGKRAALKICHASILDARFTSDTFLREARVVHMVDHPGVCDVFATGTHDGRPYLAMERLTGKTLGNLVEKKPLSHVEALAILVEVCDVLDAAHAAGVVHRDLKLDNVFVLDAPTAGGIRTKLLDWGVARVLGEADPMRGMIAGTLTYVAPEQLLGDEVGPEADVYSLGVLAYQLLFGQPPFASPNDLVLLRKHLNDPPPAPSSLWAKIPADLESLLLAMLAKDPAARPDIGEVRRLLQQLHAELHEKSRSWIARLFRPARRTEKQEQPEPRSRRLLGATIGAAGIVATLASLTSLASLFSA